MAALISAAILKNIKLAFFLSSTLRHKVMEESVRLIEVQASLPKWCVCLCVHGPMTQSAADLRNVFIFLSNVFPLKQPLSHCRSEFLL